MKNTVIYVMLLIGIMGSLAYSEIAYYSIPANAFFPAMLKHPSDPGADSIWFNLWPWSTYPSPDYVGYGPICASVNIPDSAVINDFRAWVYDGSSTDDAIVWFIRQPLWGMDTSTVEIVAACTTSGASGLQEIIANTITNAVVDNSTYKYYALAGLARINTMMVGVRIRYDYTSFVKERQSTPQNNPMEINNYPNPSRHFITIVYSTPVKGNIAITIYNEAGQQIRSLIDSKQDAGQYSIIWDGRDDNGIQVSSGTYFYQIKVGTYTSTKKIIIIK